MNKCLCILKVPRSKNKFYDFEVGKYYNYTTNKFTSREYPEGYNVEICKGNYIYFRKHKDNKSGTFGLFSKHFKTIQNLRKDKIKHLHKNNDDRS